MVIIPPVSSELLQLGVSPWIRRIARTTVESGIVGAVVGTVQMPLYRLRSWIRIFWILTQTLALAAAGLVYQLASPPLMSDRGFLLRSGVALTIYSLMTGIGLQMILTTDLRKGVRRLQSRHLTKPVTRPTSEDGWRETGNDANSSSKKHGRATIPGANVRETVEE
jgi:hypothetical protein